MLNILNKNKFFELEMVLITKKNFRDNKNKIPKYLKNKLYSEGFPHLNNLLLEKIKRKKLVYAFCTAFPNLLKLKFIKCFIEGVINIHPSLLPDNKGSHSTFHTIMNNSEIGSTIHLMNEKFDSGPILFQNLVENNLVYTAKDVFKKSREMGIDLLKKNLINIYNKNYKIKKNKNTKINYKKDIKINTTLKLNEKYSGKYLWSLIRAVNFKKNGFYVNLGKKKFKVLCKIENEK